MFLKLNTSDGVEIINTNSIKRIKLKADGGSIIYFDNGQALNVNNTFKSFEQLLINTNINYETKHKYNVGVMPCNTGIQEFSTDFTPPENKSEKIEQPTKPTVLQNNVNTDTTFKRGPGRPRKFY